ncbi:hypothetical protein C8J57DRAFT_598127 [Mycena rebaudengoi]|nr:hypothetical protein C8J57DRAFT_598127 [Mycena rebaudengoi]
MYDGGGWELHNGGCTKRGRGAANCDEAGRFYTRAGERERAKKGMSNHLHGERRVVAGRGTVAVRCGAHCIERRNCQRSPSSSQASEHWSEAVGPVDGTGGRYMSAREEKTAVPSDPVPLCGYGGVGADIGIALYGDCYSEQSKHLTCCADGTPPAVSCSPGHAEEISLRRNDGI